MTPTISLTGLTRRYSDQLALDGVSVDIEGGAITGLRGRNGAGKTTLMRIIAGQEFPSAGRVQVLGANPTENDAILRRIVLIREDQIYPDLGSATMVSGPDAAVEQFIAGRSTWDRPGLRVFVVAQVAVLLAVGLTADRFGAWPRIGQFFTDLTAPGLTGLLAAIAALLIVGGFVTMRRVRV